MSVVAGADFGTQSVRVTLLDTNEGPVGTGVSPLETKTDAVDHDLATQSHDGHINGLRDALKKASECAGIDLKDIAALAFDTTGSTVIPVGQDLKPLDDYYLWRDHRAKKEAAEITTLAHEMEVPAIDWCGGVYSHEWGFAKVLHWLRNNPGRRDDFYTALEHCDMMVNTLVGNLSRESLKRSQCAIGHKWLWHNDLGGLPDQAFFSAVDPLLDGIRDKMAGEVRTSDYIAGRLTSSWADFFGLSAGIPIPVGAFDAHWDAIGAGGRSGDMVNIVGTSTCVIALAESTDLVRGVCGVVDGSSHPGLMCIEAGLSAVGDLFQSIASRAGRSVEEMSKAIEGYRPGQSGLLRVPWDNGDRSVLVRADLSGTAFGWRLGSSADDELFAAIEGTAFLNRIILDRIESGGPNIKRVINTGGIPSKNVLLNQVYANVLERPVLVPKSDPTGLGACIFASLACGDHKSIEDAQKAICPDYIVFEPDASSQAVYSALFPAFEQVYFGLGEGKIPRDLMSLLSETREISLRS